MIEVHIRHGQATPESNWQLTEQGRQEVQAANRYLHTHFPRGFQIGFHSPFPRAEQTAQLLGYLNIKWIVDPRLCELSWGQRPAENPEALKILTNSKEYRSLSWRAHHTGDSWEDVLARVTALYKEVDRLYPVQDRLFVSHGGTLRMTRMYREKIPRDRFPELFEKPYKFFTNCQLIIYSDEDPKTGRTDPEKRWVKSVCPWDEGHFGHDWLSIT